jgi:hypothetical protein
MVKLGSPSRARVAGASTKKLSGGVRARALLPITGARSSVSGRETSGVKGREVI